MHWRNNYFFLLHVKIHGRDQGRNEDVRLQTRWKDSVMVRGRSEGHRKVETQD
jgi:hypothetical protein